MSTTAASSVDAAKTRKVCVETMIDNEKYLRAHPEVAALFGALTRRVLLRRPEDPVAYAAEILATEDLKALAGGKE
jgi:hypothetical protein